MSFILQAVRDCGAVLTVCFMLALHAAAYLLRFFISFGLEFKAYLISALNSIKARLPTSTVHPLKLSDMEDEPKEILVGLPADSMHDWEDFEKKLKERLFRLKVV